MGYERGASLAYLYQATSDVGTRLREERWHGCLARTVVSGLMFTVTHNHRVSLYARLDPLQSLVEQPQPVPTTLVL